MDATETTPATEPDGLRLGPDDELYELLQEALRISRLCQLEAVARVMDDRAKADKYEAQHLDIEGRIARYLLATKFK